MRACVRGASSALTSAQRLNGLWFSQASKSWAVAGGRRCEVSSFTGKAGDPKAKRLVDKSQGPGDCKE